MLKDVYPRGDDAIRLALIQGALEHLFEDPTIVEDFEEWRTDERLRPGYDDAYAYGSTIADVMKSHNQGPLDSFQSGDLAKACFVVFFCDLFRRLAPL